MPVGEAGLRRVLGAIPQMIWVAAPGQGVQYVSPRWTAFTGMDAEELRGSDLADVIHPGDVAAFAAGQIEPGDASTRRFAPTVPIKFRLRRRDGVYRDCEATVEFLHDSAGDVEWLVGSASDVTDEREATTEARERQEQLRAALSLTGLARYSYYPGEQRIVGDARLSEMLGVPAEELMSREGIAGYLAQIHPDDAAAVERGIAQSLAGGADYDVTYRILRPNPDGTTSLRWISGLGRTEFAHDGTAVRMIGVVEDITDRRREEEDALQSQKREAIGLLASGVAHDFNNVMSAVLSNASFAEAEIAAGRSPDASLAEITRGVRRAADMVRRLVAVGRDEEPVAEPFDVGAIVHEACALLAPTLPSAVKLSCHVADALPQVVGDATQLHQVTMNLVTNAGHAVEGTGTVTVRAEPVHLAEDFTGAPNTLEPGDYVVLRVTDDGVGMSEGLMRRAFDPYFTTRPAGEGTGLGLTASRRIAQAHGGDIHLRSVPGDGTSVSLILPAASLASPPHAGDATPDPETDPDAAMPRGAGTRVVYVDDERALVRLAERALPASGYATVAFDDPERALTAILNEPGAFDVLVTDLSMPQLSGLDLIERVRAASPDIAVVLSSGYLNPSNRDLATRLEVDVIIPKPCSIGDLTGAIDRAVAERR